MSSVTGLLLAAGYGSRIADVTDNPKSLLQINGKALMDWHFERMAAVGIKDVVVVVGFKKEILESYLSKYNKDFNITFALNEDFRVKGNTYSLLFGLEKIKGSFLLFDADLIYETSILDRFMKDKNENSILVGESSIDDIECAKAMIDRDGYVRMTIDKRAVTKEEREKFTFAGEAIGIIKFSKEYKNDLYEACKTFLSKEENVSKNWEHVMNEFLLNHNMPVHEAVSDKWVEIDNLEDLNRAKTLFGDK